jgi:hypothetical protein
VQEPKVAEMKTIEQIREEAKQNIEMRERQRLKEEEAKNSKKQAGLPSSTSAFKPQDNDNDFEIEKQVANQIN